MANTETVLDKKTKFKIQEPKNWKVIMVNDDHTPMEFVIGILTEIFHHTPDVAKEIMIKIHTEGSGVAGVYAFEIAEAKSVEATSVARSNGFPLQVKLEED
jgi:ATP-dependent Clp protease adaptor protein ClpS